METRVVVQELGHESYCVAFPNGRIPKVAIEGSTYGDAKELRVKSLFGVEKVQGGFKRISRELLKMLFYLDGKF